MNGRWMGSTSSPWRDSFVGPTVDPTRFRGPDEQNVGGWKVFPTAWPADADDSRASDVVRAQVAALPEHQRVVIILRDVRGLSSETVRELLGLAPADQRVLLHRARASVRCALEGEYTTGRTS